MCLAGEASTKHNFVEIAKQDGKETLQLSTSGALDPSRR